MFGTAKSLSDIGIGLNLSSQKTVDLTLWKTDWEVNN
jgi:hypothetical protein